MATPTVVYSVYAGEEQLEAMTKLFAADLSEPYSIFTYRYFLHQWPHLSFVVRGGRGDPAMLLLHTRRVHSALRLVTTRRPLARDFFPLSAY